jgi:hypothetical protein
MTAASHSVAFQKFLKENSLVTVVYIAANKALSGATLTLRWPAFLNSSVAVKAFPPADTSNPASVSWIAPIAAGTHAVLAIEAMLQAAPQAAAVDATFAAAGTSPETVPIPLPLTDLLRPLALPSADDFGAQWVQPSMQESVVQVPSAGANTVEAVASRLGPVHVHVVHSIPDTMEVIAATRVMGTPQACLVHAQVAAAHISVRVKTPDAAFSGVLAAAIQTAMS